MREQRLITFVPMCDLQVATHATQDSDKPCSPGVSRTDLLGLRVLRLEGPACAGSKFGSQGVLDGADIAPFLRELLLLHRLVRECLCSHVFTVRPSGLYYRVCEITVKDFSRANLREAAFPHHAGRRGISRFTSTPLRPTSYRVPKK